MKLKKAGIITKIVVVVLALYAIVMLITLTGKTAQVKAQKEALRQQAMELEIENAELEYSIEHSGEDDTIADIAHDEMDLIGPDEKVFYDSGN